MGTRKDAIALLNKSYVLSFILTISIGCLAYLLQNYFTTPTFHSSIGHSPFVANYGFDPRAPYNLIDPPIDLIPQQNNEGVLQRLFTIHNFIVDQFKFAKSIQNHYANQLSTPK
jgi:hypothetical protein